MKYKKKNKIVDAIRVKGTPENDKEISEFVGRLVGVYGYEVPNGTVDGDYVKIGRNGAVVVSKRHFEDKFTPLDECQTIFNSKKLKKLAKAFKKINKNLLKDVEEIKTSPTPTGINVDETMNHASDGFDYAFKSAFASPDSYWRNILTSEFRKKLMSLPDEEIKEKFLEGFGKRETDEDFQARKNINRDFADKTEADLGYKIPGKERVENKIVDLKVYKIEGGTGYGCTPTRGLPFDATCYSETAGGAKYFCETILTANGYSVDAIEWPQGMDLDKEEAAKVFRSFGSNAFAPTDFVMPIVGETLEESWANVDPSPIEIMHEIVLREFHKYRGNSNVATTALTSSDLIDWLMTSKKEIFSKWPILQTPVPKDCFIRYSKYDPQRLEDETRIHSRPEGVIRSNTLGTYEAFAIIAKDIRDKRDVFNGYKFNVAESIMKEIESNPTKTLLENISRGAEHFVDLLSAQDESVQALWPKNALAYKDRLDGLSEPTLNDVLNKAESNGESVSEARNKPCLSAAIDILIKHLLEDNEYRIAWENNIIHCIKNGGGIYRNAAQLFIDRLCDNSEKGLQDWGEGATSTH